MNTQKRLYIVTGKGGVGKSTISLALTQTLQQRGLKAKYLYFKSHNDILSQLDKEDHVALDLFESAQGYIAKKIKSLTIAKWIVHTAFFRAFLNIIPGFNFIIFLGQTFEILESDPKLVLILDAPASGHALTMLEATKNFSEIFKSGVIFDDAAKMLRLLFNPNYTQIITITLPTALALQESQELNESIFKIGKFSLVTWCNNCYGPILNNIDKKNLPPFLAEKLALEEELKKTTQGPITFFINHVIENIDQNLVSNIAAQMTKII